MRFHFFLQISVLCVSYCLTTVCRIGYAFFMRFYAFYPFCRRSVRVLVGVFVVGCRRGERFAGICGTSEKDGLCDRDAKVVFRVIFMDYIQL